jgi:hypothetical protein
MWTRGTLILFAVGEHTASLHTVVGGSVALSTCPVMCSSLEATAGSQAGCKFGRHCQTHAPRGCSVVYSHLPRVKFRGWASRMTLGIVSCFHRSL